MGSQTSSPQARPTEIVVVKGSKTKKLIATKIENADKTGILSLADVSLKGHPSIFDSIVDGPLALKIRVLDISNNDFRSIPRKIVALQRLKVFLASRCCIQQIPNINALPRLKKCSLNYNDLEECSLGILPQSLTILDLNHNHFVSIPANLSNLINLTELDLSANRLSSTVGLGRLFNLRKLSLDDNILVEISGDCGLLLKLQILSIKNNKLASVPKPVNTDATPTTAIQCIPESVFANTAVIKIELGGNVGLIRSDVMNFEGVDAFLERRKGTQDKNLQGGALMDLSLFGI